MQVKGLKLPLELMESKGLNLNKCIGSYLGTHSFPNEISPVPRLKSHLNVFLSLMPTSFILR